VGRGVLGEDVLAVAGQLDDGVVEKFELDQFLEGEDGGDAVERLDVVAVEDEFGQLLVLGDAGQGGVGESAWTGAYLLLVTVSELSFQSGSPSSEVSLLSLMTSTSMPLAFSSVFLTSLPMEDSSRLLRSSSIASYTPPSSSNRSLIALISLLLI
jgi:hypothetical protein